MNYDVTDPDKTIALEMAMDVLGDLSEDGRLEGSERDAIGVVRQIMDELLDGTR